MGVLAIGLVLKGILDIDIADIPFNIVLLNGCNKTLLRRYSLWYRLGSATYVD